MLKAEGMVDANAVPLSSTNNGNAYNVQKIAGQEQRRLCELGFVEGAKIHVVNRARRDMMVLRVGGARIAVARGIADDVWVKPAEAVAN